MIRLLYNLLWPIGLLLFLPGYLVKMFRRGGYRKNFGQRLGFYSAKVCDRLAESPPLWLHAVSVGEVAIALKLAGKIRELEPRLEMVLTTTTTTGYAFATSNAPSWLSILYSPLDFWPIMRRAFRVIRPAKIVLVEAEVWPNMLANACRAGVPVALVNARLSPRSEKRFLRFASVVGPLFRQLDLVGVQNPADVERWTALGVSPDRVRLTGSVKFDPPETAIDYVAKPEGLFFFGGSTHAGEEEALARVFLHLRPRFPSLTLFIAPRHVERCRSVRKQLEDLSLRVRFTSEPGNGDDDCVLLDKTGELQRWYGMATVAFVGKSLFARGGQNPVEPIMAGVPVVFGPHMENFAALADALVRGEGAVQVENEKELERAVDELLRDEKRRIDLVGRAAEVLRPHRGATLRTAQLICDL